MKRSVIRKLGRLVPPKFRERAKRYYLAQSLEAVTNRFTLTESASEVNCRVDDAFSFSAPIESKSDLAHYATSFEGRAEFAALSRAAAEQGGILFDVGAHCGLISALCWYPLVRGMQRSIDRMMFATASIADGDFDVTLDVRRTDEIGLLAASIARMSSRLQTR